MDHLASCDFTRLCTYEAGQIATLGYPGSYPQRSRCTWNIVTDQGSFIVLTFIEFNVASLGKCDSTSLNIYNGDREDGQLIIGQFCNSQRPPDEIWSDYNHLFLIMQSGAEEPGNGFLAQYVQSSRVNISAERDQG